MRSSILVILFGAAAFVLGNRDPAEARRRLALQVVSNHAWDDGKAAEKANAKALQHSGVPSPARIAQMDAAEAKHAEAYSTNRKLTTTFKSPEMRKLSPMKRDVEDELYARGWLDAYIHLSERSLSDREDSDLYARELGNEFDEDDY